MKRTSLGNFLLLLLSIAVTFVLSEIVFRFMQERKSKISYTVASRSIYQYDSEFGYRYSPNARATIATVRGGSVVLCDNIAVGPYGNLGNGMESWTDNDIKIAVFGDSFTSNPTHYHSWTEHIAAPLSAATGKHVSVMNLARDGYGVLSMVHQAAKIVPAVNPDLIVLAFIADDLSRGRFWRTNVSLHGSERLFVSTENSSRPDMAAVQDYMIIEPQVSSCDNLVGKDESDRLIEELHRHFWTLQDESLRSGVVRYTTSMLYNRLRYDDPFFSLRKVPRMPRVSFSDFRENATFTSDVQNLIGQPAPVVFAMLPVYQDLVAGEIQITEPHEKLLASFASLVQTEIVNLYNVSKKPEKPFERYFLLPHDPHPSEYGSRWYARQMVEIIKKKLFLTGSKGSLQQK